LQAEQTALVGPKRALLAPQFVYSRDKLKLNRDAALADWRGLGAV
jgi:hypothetical protein